MIDILSSPVATALTETLAHFLWQGLLVAACYWALQEAAGIRSARIRYATAMVALVIVAACPLLTFTALYNPTITTPSENQVRVTQEAGNLSLPTDSALFHQKESVSSEAMPDDRTSVVANAEVVHNKSLFNSSRPYLLLLWMAGVILSGARLMAGLVNIIWLRWGRTEIDTDLLKRSQQMARRLGLATARVFSSEHIREAAVVGFWRPVVLLPASWITALPPDVLEAVIAHELAHIRRYDVWVNLLQRIVETLLFYHPAVWWLSSRIRLEREMCCDELAVEATGERGNYVIALEHVGRLQVCGTLNLATPFTGDRNMKLLHRVRNVLKVNGTPDREPTWLVGIVAVVLPCVILGTNGFPVIQNTVRAQERDGARSAEAETGPRRSAEKDSPRRSAEAENGPRRSAEAETGARRSAEGERETGRSPEREDSRAAGNAFRDFKPKTEREAALLQMIMQLQREVAVLRREVQSRSGDRPAATSRDGDAVTSAEQFKLPANWQRTKEGRVFKAYDKNGDEIVSLDEWLAMTNGNISPARRAISTKHFNDAEPGGDGRFSPAEFIWWRLIGSKQAVERARGDRPRDGEKPASGARDGDRAERGPRDGESAVRKGPRDGEREANSGQKDQD